MSWHIVTIKLDRRVDHDPKNKKIDTCVVSGRCTDATGQHHSFVIETIDLDAMRDRGLVHITRVEDIAPDTIEKIVGGDA